MSMTRGRKVWSEIVQASGQKVAVFALSLQVDSGQCSTVKWTVDSGYCSTVHCTVDSTVQYSGQSTVQHRVVCMRQCIVDGTVYSTLQYRVHCR